MKPGSWPLETNFFTSLLQPLAVSHPIFISTYFRSSWFSWIFGKFPFWYYILRESKKKRLYQGGCLSLCGETVVDPRFVSVVFFCGGEEIQKNSRSWLNLNTMLCLAVTVAHSGNIRNDDPPDVNLLAGFFSGLSRLRKSSQVTWSFREILCWGVIWFNKSRQIDQLKRMLDRTKSGRSQ